MQCGSVSSRNRNPGDEVAHCDKIEWDEFSFDRGALVDEAALGTRVSTICEVVKEASSPEQR